MNTLFYSLAKSFKVLPLKVLQRLTQQKAIFPFYHLVSDVEVIHVKHLYNVRTSKLFENDLDFLLKNYRPIAIKDLLKSIHSGTPLTGNTFLLSFDDGLSQFYDVVAPILKRKGIPAINFLNSDFVDNNNLFYRYKQSVLIEKYIKTENRNFVKKKIMLWFEEQGMKVKNIPTSIQSINYNDKNLLDELALLMEVDFQEYLKEHQPYLTTSQIHSLIDQGFQFGAHSIDHPLYSSIQLNEQLIQTKKSMDAIANKFGLDDKIFSFPFTDYGVSKNFFELVYSKENRIADLTFASSGIKNDPFQKNIQRIPIEIDNYTAKEIITGEYLYYIFKSVFNKNTIKRKDE